MHRVSSERIFMDFALNGFFFFFLYYYYPQWIFTMSPQREFSWVLSSVASFILFSPVDLYRVSPKRIFMDFALSGFFSFIIPSGFSHVSSERIFMGLCPQWLLFFYFPQWIFTMSPQREFSWTFALSGPFIFIPSGYRVSSESTFTKFSPSGFYFILNPQQFCPPRIPFYFIVVMHEHVDS
jgi:hypothetical protein